MDLDYLRYKKYKKKYQELKKLLEGGASAEIIEDNSNQIDNYNKELRIDNCKRQLSLDCRKLDTDKFKRNCKGTVFEENMNDKLKSCEVINRLQKKVDDCKIELKKPCDKIDGMKLTYRCEGTNLEENSIKKMQNCYKRTRVVQDTSVIDTSSLFTETASLKDSKQEKKPKGGLIGGLILGGAAILAMVLGLKK